MAAYIVGFIGLMQYLGVTTWLMSFYPGGNLADKSIEGYDFFRNFLSDLGRPRAFRLGANPTAIYYAATLAIAGVARDRLIDAAHEPRDVSQARSPGFSEVMNVLQLAWRQLAFGFSKPLAQPRAIEQAVPALNNLIL